MKFIRTIALSIAILSLFTLSFGSYQINRIRFAKGKTSTIVRGTITNADKICYFARGNKGQTLTASVKSKTGKVVIFESGETNFTEHFRVNGDLSICVDNLGKASTYTLSVSIK